MKDTKMLFIIVAIVLIVGGFIFVNGKNGTTANVISDGGQVIQGQMQQVVLSQDGYNYKDTVAQAGKPITLSADGSVGGCLRSVVFNIDGKKYSKYLRAPDDTLELPALSRGTYSFSCAMGMGYGKLIIK
ncbi:MAG: hypothetical protein AABX29_06280 [Nanoarchaeota archaeon]